MERLTLVDRYSLCFYLAAVEVHLSSCYSGKFCMFRCEVARFDFVRLYRRLGMCTQGVVKSKIWFYVICATGLQSECESIYIFGTWELQIRRAIISASELMSAI